MTEFRRLLIGIVAVLVPCTLAACSSGSSSSSPASGATAQLNGTTSLGSLYSSAKKEGSVVWMVGAPTQNYSHVVAAFEAKYPGIHVQLVTVPTPEIATRVITESSAHSLSMDLIEGRINTIGPLLSRGLLTTIATSANAAALGVPTQRILAGGTLLYDYDFSDGWIYNTKLVQPAALPKTWQDLLNAQWRGKLVVDAQGTMGVEVMPLTSKWSSTQYQQFLAELKNQQLRIAANGPSVWNVVATGQSELGAAPLNNLGLLQKKGAPLAVVPLGPVVSIPSGNAVPKGVAHPAAARLLALFLASNQAEAAWAQDDQGFSQPCGTVSPLAKLICNAGLGVVTDTAALNGELNNLIKLNVSKVLAPGAG